MTHNELNQKFEVSGTKTAHFIRWAATHGVTVHAATVSRHRAGTQGITAPWVLAYLWYFDSPN